MATIKEEQIRALPGWQARGDGVSRTFRFDDFGVATR
jgi:pterin-4a-carbinolamine dehydratase